MRIMRLAVIMLAAVCSLATAGSKPPETFDVWLRAGVDIDAAGHVQDLQWEEQSKVHALIAEHLAPIVRRWEFEPATVDGRPASTQTGLLIHVLGDELADGSVVLRLSDAARLTRDEVIDRLAAAGIGTSVHYVPLHRQPYWRDRYGLRPEQFPVADRAYQRMFSIPLFTAMSDDEQTRVIAALKAVLR